MLLLNPFLIAFFEVLYFILNIYMFAIIGYILLSWVPELRNSRIYAFLHQIVDPYLRIFRGFLVFGNFDFTPIIGILLLRFFLMFMADFIQTL